MWEPYFLEFGGKHPDLLSHLHPSTTFFETRSVTEPGAHLVAASEPISASHPSPTPAPGSQTCTSMLSLHMGARGPRSGSSALMAAPFPAEPPLGEAAMSMLVCKGLKLPM